MNKILEWLWSFRRDKCQFCFGRKGGVLGNENIIGGVIVCDYCHALLLEMKPDLRW